MVKTNNTKGTKIIPIKEKSIQESSKEIHEIFVSQLSGKTNSSGILTKELNQEAHFFKI